MAEAANRVPEPPTDDQNSVIPDLLRGYRFSLCADAESAARALAVRRQVYVDGVGYRVPVPDEYDHRSWLLLAEDMTTGQAVGTMRLTPRLAGPLECEEYFQLPARLQSPRSVELNRFAILPEYRKGKTFLPTVSVGLFKLVYDFLRRNGAHYMVVASKPERTWTYRWLCYESTGQTARYEKLAGAEHELLWQDFRHASETAAAHPFREIFLGTYPEVVLPRRTPRLGLAGGPQETLRLAMGA
jgi:N-acyl-L-homoserine lactone synthetase